MMTVTRIALWIGTVFAIIIIAPLLVRAAQRFHTHARTHSRRPRR